MQFTRSVTLTASQVVVFAIVNFARSKIEAGAKTMANVIKLLARPFLVLVKLIVQDSVFGRLGLNSAPLSVIFSQEQSADSNLLFSVNLYCAIVVQSITRFP